ncbi:MAG: T9SS type A sorting domain-containing protein [Bacteroidia bacterium]
MGITVTLFLVFIPFFTPTLPPACGTAGSIERGTSSILDPNSDGYFSVYNGSGYTITSNEYTEFEPITGAGGADVEWTRINGIDPPSDLQASGGCGNTDIVTDGDGGADYAYYSIADPDGTANNGDEILAVAIRISDKVSGAFGFLFLLDTDNNCETGDPNNVCGNPCFEYEVELVTGNTGGNVNLYYVDGCYGTSDCNTAHGAGSVVCQPCNTESIQVCAGSSACGTGSPVLWVFYIQFSQLSGLSPTSTFRIVPASNTSGNPVIYKSANVSDYGGIDDINDIGGSCNCTVICSGNPCVNCEQDCALGCAAANNGINEPLPVELLHFEGKTQSEGVHLFWSTARENQNKGFEIERATEDRVFTSVGWVNGSGDTQAQTDYTYFDVPPGYENHYYYRLRQNDFNGESAYSQVIEVFLPENKVRASYMPYLREIYIWKKPSDPVRVSVIDIAGKIIFAAEVSGQEKETIVRLPALPGGVYFFAIYNREGIIYRKKIVL